MPTRNRWHLAFAHLIEQRAPPGFLVRREVPLADEPQRADLILIRRQDQPPSDGEAQVLRGLWPHLRKDTVLEFKSPRSDFRRTDLMRVLSYGAQYHILEHEHLPTPDDLTLVLVVPAMSSALHDEIARIGLRLTWIGGGYGRIDGALYTLFLALTDDVSHEERDEFLRIFSHHKRQSASALAWWRQWRAEGGTKEDIETMEGDEEIIQQFVDSLTPEQRLAGLTPAQRLLANSDETLRALSDDYLRSLPDDVQDAIRERIGHPSE